MNFYYPSADVRLVRRGDYTRRGLNAAAVCRAKGRAPRTSRSTWSVWTPARRRTSPIGLTAFNRTTRERHDAPELRDISLANSTAISLGSCTMKTQRRSFMRRLAGGDSRTYTFTRSAELRDTRSSSPSSNMIWP